MNYRTAELDARQRAMLDFTALLTSASYTVEEAHRQSLRMLVSATGIFGTLSMSLHTLT